MQGAKKKRKVFNHQLANNEELETSLLHDQNATNISTDEPVLDDHINLNTQGQQGDTHHDI